ncbi:MAG: biotin--[acetyl-CoA-carboxylase] ligase [Oscillospiraceae bacterium]|jgi:BirA family biotin operon repressor/biotin-[acetyl-CoA-carboxylase] ligase|nr:biotin--[acetyl-CoA-carboxylase] ligase [Oscillospiraceae bacterium]
MAAKDHLIPLLEQNRDRFLSGQEIAKKLGVTRAAVWKAVRLMERDGYVVEAVTNRGYRLAPESGVFSAQAVAALLPEGLADVRVYPSLDSSNNKAKELAAAGCPHGTAVFAATQTGGRGRYGRAFASPAGGMYLSVVLRVGELPETETLTAAAAVSVCRAVESVTGREPQIKWVNDVLLDGKKVCGILSEAVSDLESGGIEWVVVGVGINITPDGLPEELLPIAAALFPKEPGGLVRTRLAAELLKNILPRPMSGEAMIAEYKRRLTTLGRDVTVHAPDGAYAAFAEDLDERCRLTVRLPDGTRRVLTGGEVSVKLANNNQ